MNFNELGPIVEPHDQTDWIKIDCIADGLPMICKQIVDRGWNILDIFQVKSALDPHIVNYTILCYRPHVEKEDIGSVMVDNRMGGAAVLCFPQFASLLALIEGKMN